jgi:hypothetical protein
MVSTWEQGCRWGLEPTEAVTRQVGAMSRQDLDHLARPRASRRNELWG